MKVRLSRLCNRIVLYRVYVVICLAFAIVLLLSAKYVRQFPTDSWGTLAQINATIFALAFTIPLVIGQLTKYPIEIGLFRGYSLAYMILYLFAVFLPLISTESIMYFTFSLSVLCALLLVPYLRHIQERYSPSTLARSYGNRSTTAMMRNDERQFCDLFDTICSIAVKAISERDYAVVGSTYDVFIRLIRNSLQVGFKLRKEEKDGYLFIGDKMLIVSEQAVNDRGILRLVCEKILSLDTRAARGKEFNLPLSRIELHSLVVLARAADRAEVWYVYTPIMSLIEHALYNNCPIPELKDKIENEVIEFLLTIERESIEQAYGILQAHYRSQYGEGALQMTLLAELARFYLKYDKKQEEYSRSASTEKSKK